MLQGYFKVPSHSQKCAGASLYLFNKIGTDNLLTFAKRGYIVSIVISTHIFRVLTSYNTGPLVQTFESVTMWNLMREKLRFYKL